MSAELGTTGDAHALVPGDPEAVRHTAAAMRRYGDALHEAGEGLARVQSPQGWAGHAAEEFRAAFDSEPRSWLKAGDSFHYAAGALERYSDTLLWTQGQAREALHLWQEAEAASQQARAEHDQALQHAQAATGPSVGAPAFVDPGREQREAARDMLQRARSQLATAGEEASDVVARARDQAPPQQRWLTTAAQSLRGAAATVVNDAASLANAAGNHPGLVAGALGGAALATVSSAGMATGVAADATGVGALAGGPLNVASGAGMATGAGMVAASVGGLGAEAAGDDHVEPVDPEQADPTPAPELPWEDPAVQEKLPDEWGDGQANKKGVGHRWQDPNDPGSGVRIDQGNPNNSQPTQQVDHVIVRDGGKVIGCDGEPISGSIKNNPDQSHIPLKEWKQWKSWNHP